MRKNNKSIGDLGEKIAARYLAKRGFEIIEANYSKKWGEIDLIIRKNEIIRFIEVKAASYETIDKLAFAVTHETWSPEEQVHRFKLRQISKAIETWILENNYTKDWQIDVIAIRVVPRETYASVKWIENVIFEK